MPDAGLYLRRLTGLNVEAQCCINDVALADRFALPASVRYAEPAPNGRAYEDPPVALIFCSECQSAIQAIHPAMGRRQTVWFPAPSEKHG